MAFALCTIGPLISILKTMDIRFQFSMCNLFCVLAALSLHVVPFLVFFIFCQLCSCIGEQEDSKLILSKHLAT